MGEVYRARDSRLGRQVAIKVLPADVAHDGERLARFEREARTLAALNHPNIAHLYGFERAPTPFLVMELVEGETLADRIGRGAIPVTDAIAIFLEIARGLEAAHRQGIVHRDLKPANVKVPSHGASGGEPGVKILDFGLAKAMTVEGLAAAEGGAADLSPSHSPTLTLAATQRGEVLGTAAYMAPEQARGRTVDARADLWAFGVCLYEALAGRRLFAGEDAAETMALVLTRPIDLADLPAETPPALRRVLRRCLERDPARRAQHIGDLRLDLEDARDEAGVAIRSDGAQSDASHAPAKASSWARAVALAIPLAALAAAAGWLLGPAPASEPRLPSRALLSGGSSDQVFPTEFNSDLALSADGRVVVYRSAAPNAPLYVRRLDRLEGLRLAGTEGVVNPILSPDGAWVAYNQLPGGSVLKKISTEGGGTPIQLCAVPGVLHGGVWSHDGHILFAAFGQPGLYSVHENGGEPALLIEPPADQPTLVYRSPHFLPGERTVLFTAFPAPAPSGEVSDTQAQTLALSLDREGIPPKRVLEGGTNAQYAVSGHLVVGFEGSLMAVPFDPERLEVHGTPVRVASGVLDKVTGTGDFALSPDGSLVYLSSGSRRSGDRELIWVDDKGHDEPLSAPPRGYEHPRLSPDGREVVLYTSVEGQSDLWRWDLERATMTRLTFDAGQNVCPVWMPDGRSIVFASNRAGGQDLYRMPVDGTGSAELLLDAPTDVVAYSVSSDSRWLVYREGATIVAKAGLLDLATPHAVPTPLTIGTPWAADISPDGRFLAYAAADTPKQGPQIYVCTLPDPSRGRWQLTETGGVHPVWARDGRKLYYATSTVGNERGAMMAVDIRTAPTFEAGPPREVVRLDSYRGFFRSFDVAPGPRFLVLRQAAGDERAGSQVVLVHNFADELRRLAPIE